MTDTVTTFETSYSIISTFKEPKIYYSSAWTGRISREEQTEISARKAIGKIVADSLNDRIENMILYGIAFNNNGRDIDPVKIFTGKPFVTEATP